MKPSGLPPTALALTTALLLCGCAASDDRAASWTPSPSDWPAYGADAAGTRYSALDRVTQDNAAGGVNDGGGFGVGRLARSVR